MVGKLKVAVLMSTYNGADFILDQLKSLKDQSYNEFDLYVRDDGSSDNTINILNDFEGLSIKIVKDNLGNLGPAGSFMALLSKVNSDIYFFCDQDDYWLPDKINKSLNLISKNNDVPCIVHSDLILVDSKLNFLNNTFHQVDRVDPKLLVMTNKLYVQNCVVGCTLVFNEKMKKIALDKYQIGIDVVAMHDWWIAILAKNFGLILFLDEPLILYRQHHKNVSGASNSKKSPLVFLKKLISGVGFKKVNKYHEKIVSQSSLLLKLHSNELESDVLNLNEIIVKSGFEGGISSIFKLVKLNCYFSSFSINLKFFLVILFSRRLN